MNYFRVLTNFSYYMSSYSARTKSSKWLQRVLRVSFKRMANVTAHAFRLSEFIGISVASLQYSDITISMGHRSIPLRLRFSSIITVFASFTRPQSGRFDNFVMRISIRISHLDFRCTACKRCTSFR